MNFSQIHWSDFLSKYSALLIAVTTSLGYSLAWIFNWGYFRKLGIPATFVTVSIEDVISFSFFSIVLLTFLHFFNAKNDRRIRRRKLYFYILLLFFSISFASYLLMSIYFIESTTKIRLIFLFLSFLFLYGAIYNALWVSYTVSISEKNFNKVIALFFMTITFMITLTAFAGIIFGSTKDKYLTLSDNLFVAGVYNDYFIVLDYDKAKGEHGCDISLLETKQIGLLKLESIGPLKRKDSCKLD